MVKNAGMSSVKSFKSISLIGLIINQHAQIYGGAVACPGTIPENGEKNNAMKNISAVDKSVRPVIPPSATPEADSTYVVTVPVPKQAPVTVPTASANRA